MYRGCSMIHEKVLIVCEESKYTELYTAMFSEAAGKNVILLDKVFHKPISSFQKIMFANKIKGITRFVVPQLFWEKFQLISQLKKMKTNESQPVYILFLSPGLQKYYTREIIEKIRKEYTQVRTGLLFVDPVFVQQAANALELAVNTDLFDVIYSFDKNDAEKYGFKYADTPYSRYKGNRKNCEYDLYFCGSVKGRAQLLKNINDKLKDKVKCQWDIFANKSTEPEEINLVQSFTPCKNSSELLPYSQVLERTMKANCILDIVQRGQSGNTVRYYEAICNNKKLLTNNKTVLTSEYYDRRYIQYFSKAEDIDVNWIKEPCEVNFQYQGEFSPEVLIRRFISECGEVK